MFIEVQKLELFSGQILPNLKQSLAWLTYSPSVAVNLLAEMIDATFPANPNFGCLSAQF
jgi:hypothetical protein